MDVTEIHQITSYIRQSRTRKSQPLFKKNRNLVPKTKMQWRHIRIAKADINNRIEDKSVNVIYTIKCESAGGKVDGRMSQVSQTSLFTNVQ